MTTAWHGARAGLLLAAALICGLLAAQTTEPISGIYTCVDGKGRRLTSDRSIPECSDRVQKILNPSGTVKTEIGPKLTALEQSQVEQKNKAAQAQAALLEEEKRRDRALLIRYPNPASHQKERVEALTHIGRVKQSAAGRVTQLQEERVKLDNEMAFYAQDPSRVPQKLRRQINESNQAMAAQQRFIAEQDNETQRLNARFDEELLRLTPLWQKSAALPQ